MISIIIVNIIPLYILIGIGYISGRYLDVNLHSIARTCLYILSPAVFFGAALNLNLSRDLILLPLTTSFSSFFITFSALYIAKKFWSDGTAYSIASASVNSNAVYFGLPIIVALFGAEGASIYLFMNLGGAINNSSLSYYISARGRFTAKESFIRLLKLPVLYAVFIGLALNLAGFTMPDIIDTYWHYSAGALTILGMMMIGISVSKLPKLQFYWPEIAGLFLVKYVAWPMMLGGMIVLDIYIFKIFDHDIHAMMAMLSVMPLFANYVAYASENNLFPERAGSAVCLSSFLSIVIIPLAYFLIEFLGWV